MAPASRSAWRLRDDGVEIDLLVTPKAATDAILDQRTDADQRQRIRIKVRAAPEKGKANTAVERLLAGRLGLAKSAVTVTAGMTGRLKTVRCRGAPARLGEALRTSGFDPPE